VNIEILDEAENDLIEGFYFYEAQQGDLGTYFLTNLYTDIESLRIHGGIHRKVYKDYHRLLSRRFPFAVFYKVREDTVSVYAVLDCRRDPAWIRKQLRKR
jgi:plasmid stabilization system protein ParE